MRNLCPMLPLLFLLTSCMCYSGKESERTLAMIKPDGLFGKHIDMIKKVIVDSGFHIVEEMMFQFNVENVTLFYAEHSGKSFFPRLLEYMTSGPVYVMVLEKPNAISDWRFLIGPTNAKLAKVSHPNRKVPDRRTGSPHTDPAHSIPQPHCLSRKPPVPQSNPSHQILILLPSHRIPTHRIACASGSEKISVEHGHLGSSQDIEVCETVPVAENISVEHGHVGSS